MWCLRVIICFCVIKLYCLCIAATAGPSASPPPPAGVCESREVVRSSALLHSPVCFAPCAPPALLSPISGVHDTLPVRDVLSSCFAGSPVTSQCRQVTAASLQVRSKPCDSADSAVLATVQACEQVQYIESSGKVASVCGDAGVCYIEVITANNVRGWLPAGSQCEAGGTAYVAYCPAAVCDKPGALHGIRDA